MFFKYELFCVNTSACFFFFFNLYHQNAKQGLIQMLPQRSEVPVKFIFVWICHVEDVYPCFRLVDLLGSTPSCN